MLAATLEQLVNVLVLDAAMPVLLDALDVFFVRRREDPDRL